MFKYIGQVEPGESILGSGGKTTKVRKVEKNVCGPNKVHINGDKCYEHDVVVHVTPKVEEEANA